MRNAFARTLSRLAAQDPRIILLSGDIGNRLFNDYKAQFGERFFNCGVAEAHMTGMAAGLAMQGFRPITYTIVPFVTTRCLEQIRVDICYHQLPVTIVGVGGGLAYASLGATHHACEDIALMRALPDMRVLCPADALEVEAALELAQHSDHPCYIRLGKKNEPVLHTERPTLEWGRSLALREPSPRGGAPLAVLACGPMLAPALEAADLLAAEGIDIAVYSAYSVKPLDTALLIQLREQGRDVLTLEEHSLIGGFGSAVAEWWVDRDALHGPSQSRLLRMGTPDLFPHTATTREVLWREWGLDAAAIAQRIRTQLQGRPQERGQA